MSRRRNIMILNMSLVRDIKYSCYEHMVDDATKFYYFGVSQLEAASKMVIMNLAMVHEKVDKFIITATKEAANKMGGSLENDKKVRYKIGENEEYVEYDSAVEFYKSRIKDFLQGKEDNSIYPPVSDKAVRCDTNLVTDLQKENYEKVVKLYEKINIDNMFSIVDIDTGSNDEFTNLVDKIGANQTNPVNLYIDFQGGQRSFVYVLNATLDMLDPDAVTVKGRYATKWDRDNPINEIISEDRSFGVMELAAALRAFKAYGKVDLLDEYFSDKVLNSSENRLIEILKQIAESLQICSPDDFYQALDDLRDFYNANEHQNFTSDPQFNVVVKDINKNYTELLSENRTVLSCIKWSLKHDFLQQALTLIESLLPMEMYQKGIITYNPDELKNVSIKSGSGWSPTTDTILVQDAINQAKKVWEKPVNYLFYSWVRTVIPKNSSDPNPVEVDLSITRENYYTIMVSGPDRLSGNAAHFVKYKDGSQWKSIRCGFEIKDSIKQSQDNLKLLNRFFRIMFTLKQQRNTTNHAVEGERYSASDLRTAVEVFIEMAEKIYSL